ncbi:MAG: major capsid protein [Xanthobacteraceae bacterium]
MLDVFKSNAFSVVTLTDAINKIPFVPGQIGASGLFQVSPISSTAIAVEQKDGQLILVPPSPRGGPGTTTNKPKRSLLDLRIPHFEINDGVMADEVQGIRAFGQDSLVETVQSKLAGRFQEHSQSFAATEEYARIGAIKGVVTYADNTTLDLFSTFGVSQETEIDFDLDNATPAAGALRKKCDAAIRLVASNLGGAPYSGVRAEVGDNFWDDLIAHTEVRASYLNQQEASQLREGTAYQEFNFGGITWRNYRGSVNGTAFVNTDKSHLYPVGVPGLFRTYYAPADYIETVNTLGQRLYVKQYDMQNGKGIHLDVQTNALHICTRPKTLLKGKRT